MVTVLGKTFSSDDERREYFRGELRKHLPELKKIEGFPIGEDEDIIALSDPPYYTACPNPWLNDFIPEWEEEKKDIPNRVENFHVAEPYASDVSEGKNNPIYNAHSYHTKVPHPAIMRYILHYTQPGDIVFDGFAGTGMTGVAAQLCGSPDIETKLKIESEWKEQFGENEKPRWGARKAICGDLSPIASFIAYNYNTPTDVEEFEREARRVLVELEEECGWMYTTLHCPTFHTAERLLRERAARGEEPSVVDVRKHKEAKDNFSKFEKSVIQALRSTDRPHELLTQRRFDELALAAGLPKGIVRPARVNYTVWSDVFVCPNCAEEIVFWGAAADLENGILRDKFSCPNCGENELTKKKLQNAFHTIFDDALGEAIQQTKTVPAFINYSHGRKRYNKPANQFDRNLLESIFATKGDQWFPTDRIHEVRAKWRVSKYVIERVLRTV